ncbi:MAG: hypothetical protein AAGA48_21980 [Myxococcota bacterium]
MTGLGWVVLVGGLPGDEAPLRRLEDALGASGWPVVRASTDRWAVVDANAEQVAQTLRTHPGAVVVSLGRGGPETALALQDADLQVAGWINVHGFLRGLDHPRRHLASPRLSFSPYGPVITRIPRATVASLRSDTLGARIWTLPDGLPVIDVVVVPRRKSDPSIATQRTGGRRIDVAPSALHQLDAMVLPLLEGEARALERASWPVLDPPIASPLFSMPD